MNCLQRSQPSDSEFSGGTSTQIALSLEFEIIDRENRGVSRPSCVGSGTPVPFDMMTVDGDGEVLG
jgi:hypothetical protein